MTAPWQRSFLDFAGPGIDRPSDMLRVTDDEAADILAKLVAQAWSTQLPTRSLRNSGYTIRHTRAGFNTAIFRVGRIVGFYAGSYLWISAEHRGKGLSTPLILAAAEQRGGSIMPPGVVLQGYTPAGLAAHRKAHRHAILEATERVIPGRARTPDAADFVRLRLAGATR
ncbi:hypothetical protein [Ferribacterium limneticum]|uniref:hypothetical protein n=1 Tax=Ferribacterium limneticum TaxID=76259 RepID=UPI001CF819E0|nr:hypothetical protein [Ferribacterium limneticum]UCV24419.1 hypothetical protein KI613_07895 [Ferribacterium limneticum]